MQFTFNGSLYELSGAVAAGATSIVEFPTNTPASLAIDATAAGASAQVAFTLSPRAAVEAGTALWVQADIGTNGTVAGAADATEIPCPVRAVRITNNGSAPVRVEALQ